jgi:arabinose-5-phosphate isomerase
MNKRAVNLVKNGAIESAMRTVETERRGLEALERALAGGLAAPFSHAVALIGDITGRVVVTGVGKSGHIGVKLAATLASTGTPAFFIHSAEANHGDLGMIAHDDVIVAMSWSGETAELKGILSYCRRFSVPLIAITSGATSTLGREADVVILLPKEQEACPHGLAPTTSTLLQLAIGDALAVALMEARGFSAGDFHVFHPGGKLGASLTHVADIMHTGERVPLVPQGTPLRQAISTLSKMHFGCVGILDDDGRLCGIVTDGDIARNLDRSLGELNVDDIMTRNPKTVLATTLATGAMAVLNNHNISALIVIDEDRRPIGLVHFHDLLRIGVV